MSDARGTILVIEDEPAIRDLLRLHLGLARFHVREEANGRRALDVARAERFDAIILDVMLPGLDGVTLCRALRLDGASRDTPILMLTARDTESDKVLGLESGADDYVPKPFGIRELLARVEALLRRQQRAGSGAAPAPRITAGALQVDVHKREATVHGKAVDLTRQEFDLLALLAAKLFRVRLADVANISARHPDDGRQRPGQFHDDLSRVVSGARDAHSHRGDDGRAVGEGDADRVPGNDQQRGLRDERVCVARQQSDLEPAGRYFRGQPFVGVGHTERQSRGRLFGVVSSRSLCVGSTLLAQPPTWTTPET